MVTSSFVNSLNAYQELSKTSKPGKTQGDDKFKELMKKDNTPASSDDKKVSDDKGQDDRKVNDKVDKDDVKDGDQNQVQDGTDEKILSGEIAKMLANVSSVVTDVNMQENGVAGATLTNSKLVETNLQAVGVVNQANGAAENLENMQAGNVAGENPNAIVNGKGSGTEGKIQLNEGFKPVDPTSENVNMADLLKDGMDQKGLSEEKAAENLVVNVAQNSGNSGMGRTAMVENSQMVGEPEAMFKPEETIDKMAKAFVKEFSQGKREMEIALEPANLGKITIKVAYDAGKAVVSILCSERNLDIISKNSAQLAGILQQYTGDETKVVVEQPQPDYLNQQNDKNDQQQREQEYKKDNEKTNDDKETADFLEQLRLGLVKEV